MSAIDRLTTGVARGCAAGFRSYGGWVAEGNRAYLLLVASVLIAGACAGGIPLITSINDSEYLFTPLENQARDDRAEVDRLYPGDSIRVSEFVLVDGADGVWNNASVRAAEAVFQEAVQVTVTIDGNKIGFEDLCARRVTGECDVTTALACLPTWNADGGSVAGAGGSGTGAELNVAPVAFPLCVTGTGARIFVPSTLGGRSLSGDGSQVTSAKALRTQLKLKSSSDAVQGTDVSLAVASEEWELAFSEKMLDLIDDSSTVPNGVELSFQADRSLGDAVDASSSGDISLIIGTFVIMIAFAALVSGAPSVLHSKVMLAQGGVLAAGLGIAMAFGICGYSGVESVSIVGIAPFLLIGVGIDDAFIIIAAFNHTSRRLSVQERVERAMSEAGLAITITSVTDVIAFGLGVTSPFPAVRRFCIYTGLGILTIYSLMVTFFVPLLVLDARREAAGRSPYTCLRVASEPADAAGDKETGPIAEGKSLDLRGDSSGASAAGSITPSPSMGLGEESYAGKWWDELLGKRYAPWLTSPVGTVLALLLWAGLLTIGIIGVTEMKQGLALQSLAPDGHYVIPVLDANDEYFDLGLPVGIYSRDSVDLRLASVRNAVDGIPAALVAEASFFEQPSTTWIEPFHGFLDAGGAGSGVRSNTSFTTKASFNQALGLWLNTTGALPFLGGLSLEAADGTRWAGLDMVSSGVPALVAGQDVDVRSIRVEARTKALEGDSQKQADMMLQVRETLPSAIERSLSTANAPSNALDPDRWFAYGPGFTFFEQYVVIVDATVQTLLLAVAAIAAVSLLLLPRLTAVVLIVVCFASVDLMIIGAMWLFGINLNSISSINLVLSIGFSADFLAHIIHGFLHTRSGTEPVPWIMGASRQQRTFKALTTLGRPVLQGGLSSLLGLLLLAASTSYIFRVFFIMLFSVILAGLLHAVIFVPICLRIFGPSPISHHPAPQPARNTPKQGPSIELA